MLKNPQLNILVQVGYWLVQTAVCSVNKAYVFFIDL